MPGQGPTRRRQDARFFFPGFTRVRNRVLASVLVLSFLSAAGCTFLFFSPSNEIVMDAEIESYAPEEVRFRSPDGVELSGWYFRARGEERGTILVCHGNSENMSVHVKLDLWLVDAGYNLFIFDYRGYGRSGGAPTVRGVNLDAEAALETVSQRLPGRKNNGVIVFGKSLGAAVAVYTVANSPCRDRVRAVILDSAFSSYRRIAQERISASIIGWPLQYPLSWLINNDYSPADFIGRISPIPVIIVHSRRDEIVPFDHARILFETALEPKKFWEAKVNGHVQLQADEELRRKLLTFLERG